MKTIPVLVLTAVSCLSLPNFTRGQALPFQQSPPPGTPMPAIPPSGATATTATTTAVTPIPDGFFLRDGKVYVVRNGAFSAVTKEQVLRIEPNGTVTGFDGRTWQIPAGQILTTDGRTVPVDPSLLTLDDRTRAATTITGENRSGLAPAGSGHPISPPGSSSVVPANPDGFSQVPNTTGRGRTATERGSSSTVVDPGVNTVIDGQTTGTTSTSQQTATDRQTMGTNRANTTGTTTNNNATPNQRTSTGTNVDPNATGASSTATPNQLNSRGTNTGVNSQSTATPNQRSSSGLAAPQNQNTNNPNAVRSGTPGSTTGTSATGTSSTGTTGSGARSTTGGASSSSGGTSSSSGGSSTSGSSGSSGTGTSGGTSR